MRRKAIQWPPIRRVLYVCSAVGTPVVGYLRAKNYIGDLEVALWASEVTAVLALAGYNTDTSRVEP